MAAVAVAWSAEDGCRPWSTTTAAIGSVRRRTDGDDGPGQGQGVRTTRAGNQQAAVRGVESAFDGLDGRQGGRSERPPRHRRASLRRSAAVGLVRRTGAVEIGRRLVPVLELRVAGLGVHPVQPELGIGDLGLRRQRLGRGPDPVESVHPAGRDDGLAEGSAVPVLAHLGVQTEQLADDLVEPLPLAADVEAAADLDDAADHVRSDAVHHDVGVTLEQRHDGRDPVHDLALRRGLHEVDDGQLAVAASGLGDPFDRFPQHPGEGGAVDVGGGHDLADLGVQVAAQPRHGGELDPVGLLVQADPEPEVAGGEAELALHRDDVRGDEQQSATGRQLPRPGVVDPVDPGIEGVELAEHLGREVAEQGADLDPGDPGADADQRGVGVLRPLRGLGGERGQHLPEAVEVGLDPARPVDHQDRRGPARGGQTGHLPHVRLGADGAAAEVGDGLGGTLPRDVGTGLDQSAGRAEGDGPVDHGGRGHGRSLS